MALFKLSRSEKVASIRYNFIAQFCGIFTAQTNLAAGFRLVIPAPLWAGFFKNFLNDDEAFALLLPNNFDMSDDSVVVVLPTNAAGVSNIIRGFHAIARRGHLTRYLDANDAELECTEAVVETGDIPYFTNEVWTEIAQATSDAAALWQRPQSGMLRHFAAKNKTEAENLARPPLFARGQGSQPF